MRKIKDFIVNLSPEEKTNFREIITQRFFKHRISYYRWLNTPVNRINVEKATFLKSTFNIDITAES